MNPARLVGRALSAWQPDPHLGQVNYNTGILPVAALMAVVRATGLSPWLTQRLFMAALLLVGAWGAGRLVTELGGRRGAGPWLAGLVYAWHPWVVVGAATLPVRLPHAMLPWLLLATHRAVRRGGWGPAALAALAYAAMAGINGGVVNLMLAPAVPAMAAWTAWSHRLEGRQAAMTVLRIGVLAVGMSLYWLVPSLVASDTASSVLLATEDPVGVGRLSLPSEVVRGMGMWTQYVVIDGQIENLGQLRFLTSGAVGVVTFGTAVIAVALLTRLRREHRVLAGGAIVAGVVGMVGLNDGGGRGVLGAGLEWLFVHVPATAAFRTTHKVGGVLVLGIALAIGLGIASVGDRAGSRMSRRLAVAGIVGVVAVGAGPIVPGQLHPLHLDLPGYWTEASQALDTPQAGRLWFVPGNAATRYLWDYRHVDDLDTALFDQRHVVWRPTVPNGSRAAMNLLTAADTQLNLGSLSPTALQNLARLAGVDELLARTDVDWLRTHGAPSSRVRERAAEAGTGTVRTWGPTGRERGLDADVVDPDDAALTAIPMGPASIVDARPLTAPLLVIGDAFGVAALDEDIGERPVLYVDDLTDDQLVQALAAGGELVVTDTNHRRRWSVNSLSDGYTPLLRADQEVDPVDLRARSLDSEDQTVALPLRATITARPDPYDAVHQRAAGRPEFAFDGDLTTTWQYGRRGTGVDGWWELALPTPTRVDEVRVLVDQTDKQITRLELTTEQGVTTRPVVDGVAHFPVGRNVAQLRVTIVATEGVTPAPAGIREVHVIADGERLEPVVPGARLPRTLAARLESGGDVAAGLADAPVRILLTRLQGSTTDAFDDEEIRLRRRIELGRAVQVPADGIGVRMRFPEATEAGRCTTIARVGDTPLRVAPTRDADPGDVVDAVGCAPIELPATPVELLAEPDHVLDRVELVDDAVRTAAAAGTPSVTVLARSRTSLTVRTTADQPVVLSSGRARHPGWQARLDGDPVDPGASVLANGYAAGWLLPSGTHEVTVSFAPQRPTRLAQWASLAAVALAVALALLRRRRA